MRRALYLLLIFAITFTGLAQTAATTPDKTVSVTKPISEYMRQVGLLYLEQIDNFKRECGNVNLPLGDSCDSWIRILEALDDRITIAISKPDRPAGDRPFFELLKRTEAAMHKVNIHAFLLALIRRVTPELCTDFELIRND